MVEIILDWSNENQASVGEVPELPVCMTYGDSREATLRHVNDAMQLWIDTARESCDPVAEPKGERLIPARPRVSRSWTNPAPPSDAGPL